MDILYYEYIKLLKYNIFIRKVFKMLLLLGKKEDGSIVVGVQGRTYRELYETLERKYRNLNLINDDVLNLKKLELKGYAPDDFMVNGTFDHAACADIDLNLNKMWDTDYRDILLFYVENSKNTSLHLQIIA